MSIRRRKKTHSFTQINNSAALNPNLSLKAKGLLLVMMTRPEDWEFYMEWLQKQSKDGREAHQNAMKELEQNRYVIRLRVQRSDGTFKGWEYLVDDEPITDIEPGSTITHEGQEAGNPNQKPTNGKAVNRLPTDERENRLTGKPIDGKTAATNKDLTNTENYQNGGVFNLTSNAREGTPNTAQPRRPAVVSPSPPPSTTEDASLKKEMKAVREQSAEVAVLPPDGGAADAAISDEDWNFLTASKPEAAQKSSMVTEVQKVPGGAAALELVAAGEIPHDPEQTRLVLTRALGGPAKLAGLLEETPPGLQEGERHRWVSSISPERAAELVAEGRKAGGHPWTAITQLLDQEIGGKIVRGQLGGRVPSQPSSGSHAPAKHAEAVDYSGDQGKFEVGARWREVASGQIRTLEGQETIQNKTAGSGLRYRLDDGTLVPALTLMTKFEFIADGSISL